MFPFWKKKTEEIQLDYAAQLQAMRQSFAQSGPAPSLPRPKWMDEEEEPLRRIYDHQDLLWQQGQVCYGRLMEANMLLFRRLPSVDCPAQFLYSHDPVFEAVPQRLKDISRRISSFREKPEEEIPENLRDFVAALNDPEERGSFRTQYTLDDGRQVELCLAITMVFRSQIPDKRLRGWLLPLIAAEGCDSVLLLPQEHWTRDFTRLCWRE